MPLFKSHIIRGTHKFVTFFVQELVNKELFQNICATSIIVMSIQKWQENLAHVSNNQPKLFIHWKELYLRIFFLCLEAASKYFCPLYRHYGKFISALGQLEKCTNTLEKTLALLRHFLLWKVFDFIARNTVVKFALVFVDL